MTELPETNQNEFPKSTTADEFISHQVDIPPSLSLNPDNSDQR
ncbi:hypothetical protein [Ohtaekwangia koreensis]|nr:hypothetical protein [Ohtaekwangia koreensis]